MYNGDVLGEFINLKENSAIEMKWKFKDQKDYGHLMITFTNCLTDSCTVTIHYNNIPDLDALRNLWVNDIFKKIDTVFGYHLKDDGLETKAETPSEK